MSTSSTTSSTTSGLLLKDQEKVDKANEAKLIADRKLISEATKSVLDIVTMDNDASFQDFRKKVDSSPEFLVILEDANGEIKDASAGDVKITGVKYYKDNLKTSVPIPISDLKWQPGRAFFIDFTWTKPTSSGYSASIASTYDASFILECYSTEIEKRDIKPGSVYYKRNVYEATDNKKYKVVKQIEINMKHLENLKRYLEDSINTSGEKYEIVDASDGITGAVSEDPEVIFGKGTLDITKTKTKKNVYLIPENVIKVFNRVSNNLTNIKTILDTTSYKYNYSIDRWREFVIDYTENISNYNYTSGNKPTAELLVGQKAQLTDHELIDTDFIHNSPDIFYKACKDEGVTSAQKRELYSLSAFDKDFKNMVYFEPTIVSSSGSGGISLGPNYRYDAGSTAAVQIYLTPDGEYKNAGGTETYYWVNASSSTNNIDDTRGQIKFLKDSEALALFGASSRKDNLKMYQHLNKSSDEGYSNVENSFGGKRKTKKRRTHKKRSSRK